MEDLDSKGFFEPDAGVVFIGRIRTPFTNRSDCPHNVRLARVNGGKAQVEVKERFRLGLSGLQNYSHVWLLYWMDEAERDLLLQTPRHLNETRGVFSIRSPARPNPIAMAAARLFSVDEEAGILTVEQIDCRDGTPLLDIKPYRASVDAVAEAVAEG